MTVQELQSILRQCNPADKVVLSKDVEGNNFSPCEEATEGRYEKETDWSGEFGEGEGAVCLWPIN